MRGQQVWFGEEDDNNTGEVGERETVGKWSVSRAAKDEPRRVDE